MFKEKTIILIEVTNYDTELTNRRPKVLTYVFSDWPYSLVAVISKLFQVIFDTFEIHYFPALDIHHWVFL